MDAKRFFELLNTVNHPDARNISNLSLKMLDVLSKMEDVVGEAGGAISSDRIAEMKVIEFLDTAVRNKISIKLSYDGTSVDGK